MDNENKEKALQDDNLEQVSGGGFANPEYITFDGENVPIFPVICAPYYMCGTDDQGKPIDSTIPHCSNEANKGKIPDCEKCDVFLKGK